MRMTKSKTTKPRKEISYYSVSLKDGYFTESELSQYGLSENEISIILDYQADVYKRQVHCMGIWWELMEVDEL